MSKYILTLLSCIFLSGCFWGGELHGETHIAHNIWLCWWGDEDDLHLLCAFDDDNPGSGAFLIEPVVFAVGTNDDFIIAKQHPDMEKVISGRLFKPAPNGHYEIEDPADTIYLAEDDSIYTQNNKWYHTSNGWNPPDTLKPYRGIIYYHIIDLRNYKKHKPDSYQLYTYSNKQDFLDARKKLGVPESLDFTIGPPRTK